MLIACGVSVAVSQMRGILMTWMEIGAVVWAVAAAVFFWFVIRAHLRTSKEELGRLADRKCPNCQNRIEWWPGMAEHADDRLRDHFKVCVS